MFGLSGIFSVSDAQWPLNNGFIDDIPGVIIPRENEWNPNLSCFGQNKESLICVNSYMITNKRISDILVDEDDFMEDDMLDDYDELVDVE